MKGALLFALCVGLVFPSTSAAEERPDEAWLNTLRGSGSYKEGMTRVEKHVAKAYDLGAIAGALRWEEIHDYFIGLARMKGCQEGAPYARGPTKSCHRVQGPEPKLLGQGYNVAKAEARQLSRESLYPELVNRVLMVIYDYGYVQGMKHGLRKHNDEVRFAETYYRSCVARANSAEGEPVCAGASKRWADRLVERLRARVEAHGLPTREKKK